MKLRYFHIQAIYPFILILPFSYNTVLLSILTILLLYLNYTYNIVPPWIIYPADELLNPERFLTENLHVLSGLLYPVYTEAFPV